MGKGNKAGYSGGGAFSGYGGKGGKAAGVSFSGYYGGKGAKGEVTVSSQGAFGARVNAYTDGYGFAGQGSAYEYEYGYVTTPNGKVVVSNTQQETAFISSF